jgi:plastocyanin
MPRFAAAVLAAAAVLMGLAAVPSQSSVTVRMKDNHYSPSSVTVSKNTTVKWTWNGNKKHDVYAVRGPRKFHSPTKRHGTPYTHKMTVRGTYKILCSQHEGMSMTLKVK